MTSRLLYGLLLCFFSSAAPAQAPAKDPADSRSKKSDPLPWVPRIEAEGTAPSQTAVPMGDAVVVRLEPEGLCFVLVEAPDRYDRNTQLEIPRDMAQIVDLRIRRSLVEADWITLEGTPVAVPPLPWTAEPIAERRFYAVSAPDWIKGEALPLDESPIVGEEKVFVSMCRHRGRKLRDKHFMVGTLSRFTGDNRAWVEIQNYEEDESPGASWITVNREGKLRAFGGGKSHSDLQYGGPFAKLRDVYSERGESLASAGEIGEDLRRTFLPEVGEANTPEAPKEPVPSTGAH